MALKITGGKCQGCKELDNCTTFEGSIQIQIVRQASPEVMSQLRFPKLTEITGYLLVSLVYGERSLKEIFPNLAVIRGKELFLDYSLVIYQNDGLQEINLPSLTTVLDGGVRIDKNINLCYVKTIRWESIMNSNNSLVLGTNNNDCYDTCFGGKCKPPRQDNIVGHLERMHKTLIISLVSVIFYSFYISLLRHMILFLLIIIIQLL